MTRTTNARIAGFTFLFYIAVAFPSMVLFGRAAAGKGTAARLASIAQHMPDVRLAIVLSFLGCCSALVLAVTLYAITRDEDHDLAMMAMVCRFAEGITGAAGLWKMAGLLWLATAGAAALDASTRNALGAMLLMPTSGIGASFFAIGSTIFSYLFLRARTIPVSLAWLGIVASALLVVVLPLQFAGYLTGPLTSNVWYPMLAFELVLGLWLLIRGVAPQGTR